MSSTASLSRRRRRLNSPSPSPPSSPLSPESPSTSDTVSKKKKKKFSCRHTCPCLKTEDEKHWVEGPRWVGNSCSAQHKHHASNCHPRNNVRKHIPRVSTLLTGRPSMRQLRCDGAQSEHPALLNHFMRRILLVMKSSLPFLLLDLPLPLIR